MIICTADTHLDPYIWTRYREIANDTFHALDEIVSYACEHEAKAIVLAGDIFNRAASPDIALVIDRFQQILETFTGRGGIVYGIGGQHDQIDPSWLSVAGMRAYDLHHQLVELDGLTLYGFRYTTRHKTPAELELVPPVDLLVFHQIVRSMSIAGYWTLDDRLIPEHVKAVVAGDWHKAGDFGLPGGGTGYYTGSTVPRAQNEIDYQRGFLRVDDGQISRVPLPGRQFLCLKVKTQEDLNRLETVPQQLEGERYRDLRPVIFIDYVVDVPGVLKAMMAFRELVGDAVVIPKPSLSSDRVEEESIAGRPNALVNLAATVEEFTSDGWTRNLVLDLLRDCSRGAIQRAREIYDPDARMQLPSPNP